MEFQEFFPVFQRLLGCEKGDLENLTTGLFSQVDTKGGESEETPIGHLRPAVKYCMDRLLKGLAGAQPVRLNFALTLVRFLNHYTEVDTEKLASYLEGLLGSLNSAHIQMAQVLLITCLSLAEKQTTDPNLQILKESFNKNSLKEAAALAISSVPNAKALIKQLPVANDIHYLMLSYTLQKDPEKIIINAVKAKEAILQGSLKTVPRIHSIWNLLLKCAEAAGREDYLWKHFVEKEIATDDKKKLKRLVFCFELVKLTIRLKMKDMGFVLTPNVVKTWNENLFSKEHTSHELAVDTKNQYLQNVTGDIFSKLLNLTKKGIDTGIVQFLTKISIQRTQDCMSLIDYLEENLFSISVYANIIQKKGVDSKTKRICFRGLIHMTEGNIADKAKDQYLHLLKHSDDIITKTLLKKAPEECKALYRSIEKISIAKSEELGEIGSKRKPNNELLFITETQLEQLKRLNKVLLAEAIFYHNLDDTQKLIKITKSLVKENHARKALEKLFQFFLSQMSKPASYIRSEVASTFKVLIGETPREFIDSLCELISTGNFEIEAPEAAEVESEGWESLFESTDQKKITNQMTQMKDHFILRIVDLLEILIENCKEFQVWAKLYNTVISGLKRLNSTKPPKPELTKRLTNVLSKFAIVEIPHEEVNEACGILNLMVRFLSKKKTNTSLFTECICNILKMIESVEQSEAAVQVVQILEKHFKNTNSKLTEYFLKQVLASLQPDSRVLKILMKQAQDGRTHIIKLQAFELVKFSIRKWNALDKSLIKKLRKAAKAARDGDIKQKFKNKLFKYVFSILLILVQKGDISDKKKTVGKMVRDFKEVPVLKGIITQIESNLSN